MAAVTSGKETTYNVVTGVWLLTISFQHGKAYAEFVTYKHSTNASLHEMPPFPGDRLSHMDNSTLPPSLSCGVRPAKEHVKGVPNFKLQPDSRDNPMVGVNFPS